MGKIASMTDEERKKYNREKVQKSRDKLREERRDRTLEEKLGLALLDSEPSNPAKAQMLISRIYEDRRAEQVAFLTWELENPVENPSGVDTLVNSEIDKFLQVYEHAGPYSPTGSHPMGFAWSFDHMKQRLSEFKLGRLLLAKFGKSESEWLASRSGKQNVA